MKKKLLAIIGSFVLSVFAVSCSEEDDKSEAETVEYSHALPLADSIYVPDDAEMSTAVQVCPAGETSTGATTYSVYRVFGKDFAGKGEKHFVTKQDELASLVSELEKISLSEQPEPVQEYAWGLVVSVNSVQHYIPECVLADPETPFSDIYRIFEAVQPHGSRSYWFAVRKRSTDDSNAEDCIGVLHSWFPFAVGAEINNRSYSDIKPLKIFIDEKNDGTVGVGPFESKISLKELDELLVKINAGGELARETPIALSVHANAQYQRFIDVVAVIRQQKQLIPVLGVEMRLPDGSTRRMGYFERKKPAAHAPHRVRRDSQPVAPSLDMPSMKPLVNQGGPVSINAPVPMVSDLGEGLSPSTVIGDAFDSFNLGDGCGLGGTEGGGSTFEGTFYDLKKLKDGQASGLKGDVENQDAVIEELSKFFSNWNRSAVDKYYKGKHHLYASSWYLPYANADYGPIAFGVGDPKEKDKTKWECEPGAWLAVYRGEVTAPKSGYFRFIGTGDDLLAVRFNKKTVLEAGYCLPTRFDKANPRRAWVSNRDDGDNFRSEIAGGKDKARAKYKFIKGIPGCEVWDNELGGLIAGTPFKVEEFETYPVEIAIADISGDKVGFVLFIEEVDSKGEPVERGKKKYDLFRTCDENPAPDKIMQTLKDVGCFDGENRIEFNDEAWTWECPIEEEEF